MERPATRYARSGDVSIAYQSIGEGDRTIVVCPGFVSNVEVCWAEPVFHHLITRASALGRVLLFDKRGTGLSDPVAAPPTFEERTDDIRAVMDDAGVERAALYGISEGGPMAMLFAATYPERVTHLVLYGTYPVGPGVLRDEGDPMGIAWCDTVLPQFEDAIAHWGEGRTLNFLAAKVAHRPLERRLWGSWERTGSSPGVIKHLLASTLDLDLRAVPSTISAPTLVLHFRDDAGVPVEMGERLAASIPGARLAVLDGGDHVPFAIADINRAADEVEAHLTGVRPAAHPDRQLLTVVFTDIVASTERAAELGDHAWGEVVGRHDAMVAASWPSTEGARSRRWATASSPPWTGPVAPSRSPGPWAHSWPSSTSRCGWASTPASATSPPMTSAASPSTSRLASAPWPARATCS